MESTRGIVGVSRSIRLQGSQGSQDPCCQNPCFLGEDHHRSHHITGYRIWILIQGVVAGQKELLLHPTSHHGIRYDQVTGTCPKRSSRPIPRTGPHPPQLPDIARFKRARAVLRKRAAKKEAKAAEEAAAVAGAGACVTEHQTLSDAASTCHIAASKS